jgi:hypothetical protein
LATDFHTLTITVDKLEDLPVFHSLYPLFAYHDEYLYGKSDERIINYVLSSSRNGWLTYALGRLIEFSGATNLEYLVGRGKMQVVREFSGDYFSIQTIELDPEQLEQSVVAITHVFDWSRAHIAQLAADDMFRDSSDELELEDAILETVITKEPTLDERVPNADDGDGPWCLFSFLASLQRLMEDALLMRRLVLHMVQLGK